MKLKIDGQVIAYTHRDDTDLQTALAQARGRTNRVQCLCRGDSSDAPQLYVARTNGRLIPKRMPGSSAEHATTCAHYEKPLLKHMGGAIVEDPTTKRLTLKTEFPLFITTEPVTPADNATRDNSATSITLQRLLRFVFSETGFDRWSPRLKNTDGSDKRTWPLVGYFLHGVLNRLYINNIPLSQRLFIPYHRRDQHNIEGAQQLLRALHHANQGAVHALGIVIDEVDLLSLHKPKTKDRPTCFKVTTRHLTRHRIFGAMRNWIRTQAAYDASRHGLGDARHRTFIIATVYTQNGQTFSLEEGAFLSTLREYIPIASPRDYVITERALREQRVFRSEPCFRDDVPRPVLTLLDTGIPTDVYTASGPTAPVSGRQAITHFGDRAPFPPPTTRPSNDAITGS